MTYKRIQPFPAKESFEESELEALAIVWRERKVHLENTGEFTEFIKKMRREWAIETGIIERLYTWDRGVTEVLIEHGIDAAVIAHKGGVPRDEAEHVRTIINDHLSIVEGLFSFIKAEEPLSEFFIRGLQQQFTEHQDFVEAETQTGKTIRVALRKGQYKEFPNNPRREDGSIHLYAPPEFTKEEMEKLLMWFGPAGESYSPEVRAAWLHHRFTQIHPFQDGNGRVARALASLVFLKDGMFPLVIRDADREAYIGALEMADDGDLKPLVALFSRRQREAILRAIGLEQQVQQSKYANQIIDSALKVLENRFSKQQQKVSRVYQDADRLFTKAKLRFDQVATGLDAQLRRLTPPGNPANNQYCARVNSSDAKLDTKHYFQKQIVTIANRFHYFANLESQRSWLRISISTGVTFDYVLSIHGYGAGDTGILAVSAFSYLKVPKEEGGTEMANLQPASTDLFQFNWAESFESTSNRFEEWLESSLAIALAEWKKSLSE